ncbi:outer membrane protein assembly factor BamB family protein [Dictyobacter kobayashii]|uniref:outer membrane protein assembly factor BamB family protein n=1 Tax=Dictyobacter kobayashii TaxID=2014872 RepID=UPI000F84DF4D|nr:PQQ-binding-like beta-propeller repeat protein [Dictyobacter kobayashii]
MAKVLVPGSGTAAHLVAVRRESGQVVWESQATILDAGALDGKLWVMETDHSLNGISERDGSLVWHTQLGADTQVVSEEGALLYVQNSRQDLMAYRVADGLLQWQAADAGQLLKVDQGLVYTYQGLVAVPSKKQASASKYLMALRVSDGHSVWVATSLKSMPLAVKIANGVVYSYGASAVLTAIRVSDNRLLWRRPMGPQESLIEVAGGLVYIENAQISELVVLNAQTGAPAWRYLSGNASVVAVQPQMVYLRDTQGITALNTRNGSLVWLYETSIAISDVQLQGGSIYVVSEQDGVVNAVNGRNGNLLWHYDIGDPGHSYSNARGYVVQIDQGVVYLVLHNDTSLNALSVLDREILWHTSLILH